MDAVALYDYAATEVDELTIRRGDCLIVHDSAEEGWFEGELNGRVGLLPAPYVQITRDASGGHTHFRMSVAEQIVDLESHLQIPDRFGTWYGADGRENDFKQENPHGESSPDSSPRERSVSDVIEHSRQHMDDKLSKAKAMRELATEHHSLLSARSRKLAANRKPEKGNYGEYLYTEGMKRQQFKEEQLELLHEQRERQEKKQQFTPQISAMSKALKREMPVVERLLMLEQVKEEKLDKLKQTKEQEEARSLVFTPAINDYKFKEKRSTDIARSHEKSQMQEREARLSSLKDRVMQEEGVTYKPKICDKSRWIARKGEEGGKVFDRLHSEAEKRKYNLEVRKIEAHLSELADIATSAASHRRSSPNRQDSTTPINGDKTRLYEEAEMRRLRREILARQVENKDREERLAGKVAPRSRELFIERLRKDCTSVLQDLRVIVRGVVKYESLLAGVDELVDYALVRSDLEGLTREEKEVLIDRLWIALCPHDASPPDQGYVVKAHTALHAEVPSERLLDLIMEVEEGGTGGIDERKPHDVGKAALSVFQEFVRALMVKRMMQAPRHSRRCEWEGLEKRLAQLRADGEKLFAKLLRRAGLKFNDAECAEIFTFMSSDGTARLEYARIEHALTPQRRAAALVKMLKAFDPSEQGSFGLEDLCKEGDVPRGAATPRDVTAANLRDVMVKMAEIEKKLDEVRRKERMESSMESSSSDGVYSSGRRGRSSAGSAGGDDKDAEGRPPSGDKNRMDANRRSPGEDRYSPTSGGVRKTRSSSPVKSRKSTGIPRHERLHQLARARFEALFAARQIHEDSLMEQCTFRPSINQYRTSRDGAGSAARRLYEGARKSVPPMMTTEEKELQLCTFKPSINKSRPLDSPHVTPRSVASAPSPNPSARSYSHKSWTTQQNKTSGLETPPMSVQQESTVKDDTRRPLLCVDVNLAGGKSARISVYEGDDPAVVAMSFAKQHSLDAASRERLQSLLMRHLGAAGDSSDRQRHDEGVMHREPQQQAQHHHPRIMKQRAGTNV